MMNNLEEYYYNKSKFQAELDVYIDELFNKFIKKFENKIEFNGKIIDADRPPLYKEYYKARTFKYPVSFWLAERYKMLFTFFWFTAIIPFWILIWRKKWISFYKDKGFVKFFANCIYLCFLKFFNFFIFLIYNILSINIKRKYDFFFIDILFLLFFFKKSQFFLFNLLTDIAVIDNINFKWLTRFKIVYNLYSIKYNIRLFLNIFINEWKDEILSIISVYPNSNWLEREIWDMYGIIFIHHPDLRRILTDYGFKGYPLRKDFPLSGYIEIWYDDIVQNIIFKPIKLMQEFRFFRLSTVWSDTII